MKLLLGWFLLLILLAFAELCQAQTSNVETVKAWKRTHIIGVDGGKVLDPTGTIADGQRAAAVDETIKASSNIINAAQIGMSNALSELYAVLPRTNDFTGRIYLAADMDEDPDYENVYGMVIGESVDTNRVTHYYCHYNRLLANPPRTRWAFALSENATLWSDGVAPTNNVTTNYNGYACYDITVVPPSGVGNVVLRTNKFMKTGAPGYPLDISEAGITLIKNGVTNEAYTGTVVYTNVVAGSVTQQITEAWMTGLLYEVITNAVGGVQ